MNIRKGIITLLAIVYSLAVAAQANSKDESIKDNGFLKGVLDNGLTYYIFDNSSTEDNINITFINKAGIIDEAEDERGYTYLINRMAEYSTKHFPNNSAADYIKSITRHNLGMMFTEYFEYSSISISGIDMSKEGNQLDSALLYVKDISRDITITSNSLPEAKEHALKAIREFSSGPFYQGYKQGAEVDMIRFKNSDYGKNSRLITEEQIDAATYEGVKQFYDDKYQPSNQAIVVIGHLNREDIEVKIKEMFSDIPNSHTYTKDVEYTPRTENRYVSLTNSDDSDYYNISINNSTELYTNIKTDPLKEAIERVNANTLSSAMYKTINTSLEDISKKYETEVKRVSGSYQIGNNTSLIASDNIGSIAVQGGSKEVALEAFTRYIAEIERLKKYGLTEPIFKSGYTASDIHMTGCGNVFYAPYAMRNFVYGQPFLSNTVDLNKTSTLVNLSYANANLEHFLPDTPVTIIARSPENDIITAEMIEKAYKAGLELNLPEPIDEYNIQRLVNEEIPEGEILSESIDEMGNTRWELANGAQVIFREVKDCPIIGLTLFKFGGYSSLKSSDRAKALIMLEALNSSSIGRISGKQIENILLNKLAGTDFDINDNSTRANIISLGSNISVPLEVLYRRYTTPSFSDEELKEIVQKMKVSVQNRNTKEIFNDTIADILRDKNYTPSTLEAMKYADDIDVEEVKELFRKVFNGVDGAKIYINGKISKEEAYSLTRRYLAALPKGEKNESKDGNSISTANKEVVITIPMKSPTTFVKADYSVLGMDYSAEQHITTAVLKQIIANRYNTKIREELSMAYSITTDLSTDIYDTKTLVFKVELQTDKENAKKVLEIIDDEIRSISSSRNITKSELESAKSIVASAQEKLNKEMYSVNTRILDITGINILKDFDKILEEITAKDIAKTASFIVDKDSKRTIILQPE